MFDPDKFIDVPGQADKTRDRRNKSKAKADPLKNVAEKTTKRNHRANQTVIVSYRRDDLAEAFAKGYAKRKGTTAHGLSILAWRWFYDENCARNGGVFNPLDELSYSIVKPDPGYQRKVRTAKIRVNSVHDTMMMDEIKGMAMNHEIPVSNARAKIIERYIFADMMENLVDSDLLGTVVMDDDIPLYAVYRMGLDMVAGAFLEDMVWPIDGGDPREELVFDAATLQQLIFQLIDLLATEPVKWEGKMRELPFTVTRDLNPIRHAGMAKYADEKANKQHNSASTARNSKKGKKKKCQKKR